MSHNASLTMPESVSPSLSPITLRWCALSSMPPWSVGMSLPNPILPSSLSGQQNPPARVTLWQWNSFNQRNSEWCKLIGYEHTSMLTQWLSPVYNSQSLDTWKWTLPDTVVIIRDQAEECLLCQINYIAAWMNIPKEPDIMGMGIRCQDWLDDISLAQPIGLGSEDMTLNRMNPDRHLAW